MKMYRQCSESYAGSPPTVLIQHGRHPSNEKNKSHDKQLERTEHHPRISRNHLPDNVQKRSLVRNRSSKSKIEIPGFNNIHGSAKRCSRFVWLCAISVLYSLCVYQLYDRITFYLKRPTAFEMKIKKNSSINIPSITICPPYGTDIGIVAGSRSSPEEVVNGRNTTFEEFNTILENIWNETKINTDDIEVTQPCRTDIFVPCDNLRMDIHELKTFYGTCITLTMQNPLPYRGHQTRVDFNVYREEKIIPSDEPSEFYKTLANQTIFIPHAPYNSPLHEVIKWGYIGDYGIGITMRFSLKEVYFLNTPDAPCVSQSDEVKCRQRCVEKEIESTEHMYWLPFFTHNSSLDPCKTYGDLNTAMQTLEDIYYKNKGCNCPRSCDETIMISSLDYINSGNIYGTRFSLNYADNSIEVVTEYYMYPITSLISDVGGSLGFLVGLCVFSFIEIIEYAVENVVGWVNRKYVFVKTDFDM